MTDRLEEFLREAERSDYGEPLDVDRSAHLEMWPSTGSPGRVFVSSKSRVPACLRYYSLLPKDWLFVCRYGLVDQSVAEGLLRVIQCFGGGSDTVFFIGDLDPLDLHLFHVCRSLLGEHGVTVRYHGINDGWLKLMERPSARPDSIKSLSILMETMEKRHLELVRAEWALDTLLGPDAKALLDAGFKIEQEAILSARMEDVAYLTDLVRLLSTDVG